MAARDYYQRALTIVERLNDWNGAATECINLASVASFQADFAAEADYARRALDYARQVKNRHLEGVAWQNLGEAEREMGHLTDAFQHLAAAWALLLTLSTTARSAARMTTGGSVRAFLRGSAHSIVAR